MKLRTIAVAASVAALVFCVAGGASADPWKIRVGWVTTPTHMQPIIDELHNRHPEIFPNFGKTYAVESMHFRGTHAADRGARDQRSRYRGLRPRGAGARGRQRASRCAHDRRRVPGRRARLFEHHLCRAQGQPDPQGRGSARQGRRHQRDRLVRRFGDAHHAAQARSSGQGLHQRRGQFQHHAGDARREQSRSHQPAAAVPLPDDGAGQVPSALHRRGRRGPHPGACCGRCAPTCSRRIAPARRRFPRRPYPRRPLSARSGASRRSCGDCVRGDQGEARDAAIRLHQGRFLPRTATASRMSRDAARARCRAEIRPHQEDREGRRRNMSISGRSRKRRNASGAVRKHDTAG